MKKIFVLIVLINISAGIYAQNYEQRLDSLEFEIIKLEKKQTNIINQIDLHQGKYLGGQLLLLSGTGVSIITAILYSSTENNRILMSGGLIGGTLMVSGFFLSLNSFKFLKKDFDYYEYTRIGTELNSDFEYEQHLNK